MYVYKYTWYFHGFLYIQLLHYEIVTESKHVKIIVPLCHL